MPKKLQNLEKKIDFPVLTWKNEPIPDMLNKHWKQLSTNIEEYANYQTQKYLVDPDIFKMTKKQLENFKYEPDFSYDVYRFYELSDADGNIKHISVTKNKIYNSFCSDILFNVIGKSEKTKFDEFVNAGVERIYVTILKIIRTKTKIGIKKVLENIKMDLQHNYENKSEKNNKLFEKLFKKISTMLSETNIEPFKCYVQKIYSKSDPYKCYVVGTDSKIKLCDAKHIMENECVEFVDNKLKIDVLEEVNVQLHIQGLLCVDKHIVQQNSINNGLNKFYNVLNNDDTDRAVFMLTQYELLNNKYKNTNVGSDGYIANMKIENLNYVYYGFDSDITRNLKKFYLMTNHCDVKNTKIVDLISSTDYKNIVITLFEKNIDRKNIEYKLLEYMNKFTKKELLNYYEDWYVDHTEMKKEISSVKSLFFASKYKK